MRALAGFLYLAETHRSLFLCGTQTRCMNLFRGSKVPSNEARAQPEYQGYYENLLEWNRQYDNLIEQWKEEIHRKSQPLTEEQARKNAELEKVKAEERQAQLETSFKQHRWKQALRMAEMSVRVAEGRLEQAERHQREIDRAMRLHETKRTMLLGRSTKWVTPQNLEMRIQHALDNPVPFRWVDLPDDSAAPAGATREEE